MQSSFQASLAALLLATGALHAEVLKGAVKKIDPDKGTLTVTANDKDRTFTVPSDAKITIQIAAGVISPKDRLKNEWFQRAAAPKAIGYTVEVTTETRTGKEVVTKVHLFTPTRRDGTGPDRVDLVRLGLP